MKDLQVHGGAPPWSNEDETNDRDEDDVTDTITDAAQSSASASASASASPFKSPSSSGMKTNHFAPLHIDNAIEQEDEDEDEDVEEVDLGGNPDEGGTEMEMEMEMESLTQPLVKSESEIRNRQRASTSTPTPAPTSCTTPTHTNTNFHTRNHAHAHSILNSNPNISNISNNHRRRERVRECCHRFLELQRNLYRNTITLMNFLAKVLFWASLLAMSAGIVYYTRELVKHGKEPHLIAWFSAGGFVILGFPISIYGILMHLTNYYQPNVQCYVVRILWMVPIYSIESWLCLRFHKVAIYIETLRDCYESFVLYCFFQYLIEVLGGEEALILLLKDKSPTRGVHMWGFDWCVKPWVMGQPLSTFDEETGVRSSVKWTSPFFKNCKLGCLQYVLLKFISSIFVMLLEKLECYKEGDFSYKSGYLYICILTNTSQCWALYCLIFFYYATKNELGPIRPVGKFLSVKALVFFTWWQSVGIAFLHQMELIPAYNEGGWSSEDVAKGLQAYLICIEMFVASIVHTFVFPHTDYTMPLSTMIKSPNNNKGIPNFGSRRVKVGRRYARRNYMGLPTDERSYCSKTSDAPMSISTSLSNPQLVDSHHQEETTTTTTTTTTGVLSSSSASSTNHHGVSSSIGIGGMIGGGNLHIMATQVEEHGTLQSRQNHNQTNKLDGTMKERQGGSGGSDTTSTNPMVVDVSAPQTQTRTGFVNALLDSSLPRDVMDNTVGIARGDFTVEKKTLLSHAAASDEYLLFAKRRKAHWKKVRNAPKGGSPNSTSDPNDNNKIK